MSSHPTLFRATTFLPAWWLPGGHLQTLGGKYLRPTAPLSLRRERWDTPDGDFLDLDFGPDADEERPLVVILHGLEGFSRRPYVLFAMEMLSRHGMASVGLNFRGCSGEPNRLPRLYHSGETSDPRWVLECLRARFPERSLGALGFSLGGNVLLKLMGETEDGGAGLLEGAAALSVPYDLAAGVDHMEETRPGVFYTRYFLNSLKKKVEDKRAILSRHIGLESVFSSRTLREFDDRATAPLHGFRGADDYYSRCSSNQFLGAIRTPTLLLHARNDPFLPTRAIPLGEMKANPALTPLITDGGGHVGFVAGVVPGRPRFWADEMAALFLQAHLDRREG